MLFPRILLKGHSLIVDCHKETVSEVCWYKIQFNAESPNLGAPQSLPPPKSSVYLSAWHDRCSL